MIKRIAKSLELSKGDIDWDYAFLQRLPAFAKADPENTLLSIKNYFLDSNNNLNLRHKTPILRQEEVKGALDIIYKNKNSGLKQEVEKLINVLIEKGSSVFWDLKGVLE